jgi:predicted nucleotidyltransferase
MMMNTKHGLSEKTVTEIHRILRSYPQVSHAILYGSRAMGNFKNGSDIDLTLLGDHLTTKDLMNIANDLDDSFIPHTIDLSIFAALDHNELRDHIERVGVLFYEKRPSADGIQTLTSNL